MCEASPECPEFLIHTPTSGDRDWQARGPRNGRNYRDARQTNAFDPGTHHHLSTATLNLTRQPRANMSDERRPRSRFDSDEPERPVRSRFDTDRRSRSPSRRESESHRERSPVTREATDSPSNAATKNKAAAAAAAAARINAQIQAKKGIQHVDVPPIRSVRPLVAKSLCPS